MKIALVSDWFLPRLGGIELHVRNLGVRLAARGHEVTVVTPEPGPDEVEGLRVERLRIPRLPAVHLAVPPQVLTRLRAVLEAGRYDVLHAHVSIGSPLAWAAGYLGDASSVPVVSTFHSVLGWCRHLYRAGDIVLGWRSWRVVHTAVSETVAADLRRLLPGREVGILPNGIDPAAWAVDPRPPRPGRLRLAAVTRLQRRKRPGALLDVVARVRARTRERVDVTLSVLGDGPLRPGLARRIEALGLAGSVELLGRGHEDDVRALLSRSDVFVSPTRLEAFGLAALEARLAGLPVVARSEGGVGSFVRDGESGFLVDSDDAMIERLVRLALEPATLAALRARAARADGLGAFDWSRVAARHEEVYQAARVALTSPVEAGSPD